MIELGKIYDDLYTSSSNSDYSLLSSKKRFSASVLIAGNNIQKMSILDYGCGPGNFIEWIRDNSYDMPKSYYGYEVRDETVFIAKNKFPGVEFSSKRPEGESFDLILFLGTMGYAFTDDINACKDFYAKEIDFARSILSKNGSIVCTARKKGFERSKDNKLMITYTEEELKSIKGIDPILLSLFDHEWMFRIRND